MIVYSKLEIFQLFHLFLKGLKNHAVTMFEVGKLCDESLDSFLGELEKVSLLDAEGEGEVSRYFAHAVSVGFNHFHVKLMITCILSENIDFFLFFKIITYSSSNQFIHR